MTGALLGLSYEVLRFNGVKWLVTMSQDVLARVVRRRRRILRTTHKLLADKSAMGVMSSPTGLATVTQPLSQLFRRQMPTAFTSSAYSRTLLENDGGEVDPLESLDLDGEAPRGARGNDATLDVHVGAASGNGDKSEKNGKRKQKKGAMAQHRLNAVWQSSNSVADVEDSDGDSDEETSGGDGEDTATVELLRRYRITPSVGGELSRVQALPAVAVKRPSPRHLALDADADLAAVVPAPLGAAADSSLPTLAPSTSDVRRPVSRYAALVYGNKAHNPVAKRAIEAVMWKLGVEFVSVRVPLLFGAVLLYFVATRWMA
jgi:hypothetical protein